MAKQRDLVVLMGVGPLSGVEEAVLSAPVVLSSQSCPVRSKRERRLLLS